MERVPTNNSSSKPPFIPASERIKNQKAVIMEKWLARVSDEIPAAKTKPGIQIRDGLPIFLDKLCIALTPESFKSNSQNEVKEISQHHGKQRANLEGYSLVQMLQEYQILREVIINALEGHGKITNDEQDIIFSSIEQGMLEASQQFEMLSQREGKASRTLIDGIRDHAIIRTDIEGRILDWNSGAEKLLGWKKEEILGKNAAIIFIPEDLAAYDDEKEKEIATLKGKAEDKRWHIRKDGTRFYANGIMNSLIDNEGKTFGFIKVLRDDTELLRIEQEKKLAEKLAETTRKQLYDFFTQSPTAMVILEGPNHLFRLANRPYQKLVGRKVIGKTVLEAFTEEEVKRFIPYLDSVYKTGEPFIGREMPFNIPNEAGEIQEHWVNVNYFPHFDERGHVKGILCDVHEVTDMVKAKMAIQESELNFRQITNMLPNIVWTAKPDGYIDWQSDKYVEFTGKRIDTLFNSKESPMHPDDIAITAKKWNDSITSGKVYEVEHRLKTQPSGDYRWYLAKAVPILDSSGKIVKWVGSTTDIHDLKMAQMALKASEAQFRLLANSLPQIIWTSRPDGYVDWYNDWWYKYLGLPRGTEWDDVDTLPMHPDDVERSRPLWMESMETGKPFNIEQRFRRGSDGQYRWHLTRGVPIRDEQGKILKWIGANTDIHDHKILVQKLEEEKVLRDRFVAALSHDLRTPLTSARLTAQISRKSYIHDEKIKKAADRIISNLDRVDGMIQDLLDASRLRAGENLPIVYQNCDLVAVANHALEDLKHLHGNRFVLIEDQDKIEGEWDYNGIRRILENLCINAVKYGDSEQPITIQIGRDQNKMASMSIHNQGKSISPEDLKHLFEPFKRASDAQASGKKGWGIGLMLVKGVVDAHGGTIDVNSNDDEGTTFTVKLPISRTDVRKIK